MGQHVLGSCGRLWLSEAAPAAAHAVPPPAPRAQHVLCVSSSLTRFPGSKLDIASHRLDVNVRIAMKYAPWIIVRSAMPNIVRCANSKHTRRSVFPNAVTCSSDDISTCIHMLSESDISPKIICRRTGREGG